MGNDGCVYHRDSPFQCEMLKQHAPLPLAIRVVVPAVQRQEFPQGRTWCRRRPRPRPRRKWGGRRRYHPQEAVTVPSRRLHVVAESYANTRGEKIKTKNENKQETKTKTTAAVGEKRPNEAAAG